MVVGLAVLGLGAPAARAQDAAATASPSPKELWEAYPLAPEDAPATATPSEAATEGQRSPASPSRPAAEDSGGIPLAVPIALAAVLAFGTGIGLGRVRRRDRLEREEFADAPAEPAPPTGFQWRDDPQPARPAPVGLGQVRRRDRLEHEELADAPAEPAPPTGFQWRDYPQPARPAPPPPPPPSPSNGHQTFKEGLEAKRARTRQEEPH